MGLLSLSNLERQKGEFKGQIVSKFDLGLLYANNPMYFDKMRAVICLVLQTVNSILAMQSIGRKIFRRSHTFV